MEEEEKSCSINLNCVFRDLLGLCAEALLGNVSAACQTCCGLNQYNESRICKASFLF